MAIHILNRLQGNDIAIDLGTANTLLFSRRSGIIFNEPTCIAVRNNGASVMAIGQEAREMVGKTHKKIRATLPLRDGAISDLKMTELFIRELLRRHLKRGILKPNIIISVPGDLTVVEREAVREAAMHAGARQVVLVQDSFSASVGMGLDIGASYGHLVVDIGSGVMEASLLSLGGVVASRSLRTAGDSFDRLIMEDIRKRRGVLVGLREAERVKTTIASACDADDSVSMPVHGRSLTMAAPVMIAYSAKEAKAAIYAALQAIAQVIRALLREVPPGFAPDIIDRGLHLTGGVALLRQMGTFLEQELHIPVHPSRTPLLDVAKGAGEMLFRVQR